MRSTKFLKLSALSFTGVMLYSAILVPTEARERNHSGSFATGNGRSGAFSGSVSGDLKNGLTRSQSVTTGSGRVFNRSSTNSYDSSTGAFNRDVNGVNGNTRNISGTAQAGQRSGSYSSSTGKSGTFNGSVQNNGDGSITNSSSLTNQNGQTYNRSATTGYDPDTNTINRSVTSPTGNTREGEVTFTNDSQ
ncbi:MAG: hypothetical protein WC782_15955 [Methylococcaceae bacterium]|jgi:hypothetical protein